MSKSTGGEVKGLNKKEKNSDVYASFEGDVKKQIPISIYFHLYKKFQETAISENKGIIQDRFIVSEVVCRFMKEYVNNPEKYDHLLRPEK